MKLTEEEEKIFDELLKDYLYNERVMEMKDYIQHGTVTTYEHCKQVARLSFGLNRHLHLGANERIMTIGAMLHDYYLYDWHVDGDGSHRLHGLTHPQVARENAVRHFHVEEDIQEVIRTHMWPLTITKIPRSREALIVSFADKLCSFNETVFLREKHHIGKNFRIKEKIYRKEKLKRS